jgi:MFS family permease
MKKAQKLVNEFQSKKVVFEEGQLPFRIMIVVFIVVMSEQITSEVTFPFVPFMVQDFNICPPEQIGYYAGAIASAFGLAQIISRLILRKLTISLIYGKLSDRFGRKWLLIIGAIGNTLTMPLFGLSRHLWEALAFRSIIGLVNGKLFISSSSTGNSALIRAVIGDITDESTAAKAWSYWGLAFALGRMGKKNLIL